ncbi:PadR family transcriptional regulator [Proteiniclasticum sp. QWL-01]|uniref:PadR family transcriptional regulator n=1 Tax=Proteiniclasticum sp. QWL-01 TaxID=3036945 RepID=UPI00240FCF63|nr:PadR family transcriptional regulator [Proteiniclasticum sp. QWL-01]WFF72555.1 PadR family transcriptional regulator [Proteiniclasticum sp. QWL-01]
MDKSIKEMEKELHEEYKRKLNLLKKVKAEKEAVGQVFTKGILPIYVFYILTLGPANGNDIANQIAAHTKGHWAPSTGGIYPLLKKMEKQGYVEGVVSEEGRLQKIYTLTPQGWEEYDRKKELLFDKIHDALEVFRSVAKEIYGVDDAHALGLEPENR